MLKSFSNDLVAQALERREALQLVDSLRHLFHQAVHLRRPDPRILGHFADHAGLRAAWSAHVVGVKRKVLLVYEVGVKTHFSPNTGVRL